MSLFFKSAKNLNPDELKLQQPYMKAVIEGGGREYLENAKKHLHKK